MWASQSVTTAAADARSLRLYALRAAALALVAGASRCCSASTTT